MNQSDSSITKPNRRAGLMPLLAFSLLWIGPIVACGSFQPRPTPVPTLPPAAATANAEAERALALPTNTPVLIIEPTATFTPDALQATATPVPVVGGLLTVGQPARVAVPGGLNIRQAPSTAGVLVTRLGFGQRLSVLEGPTSADGYIWWKVDDGQGNVGWGAQGDGTDQWLSAQVGEAQPVNRSPRVGDRVRVTMEASQLLTIRTVPGTNAAVVKEVNNGSEFTVLAGPQSANGYFWFQIRSDDGVTEGWAADGTDGTRWLSPLE
ncbi:MAG: SH3 domain-containing protein [Caldilineaceae bacterium]|nr:SH3 domain-containing protein [Caldilineaceae bacterium]